MRKLFKKSLACMLAAVLCATLCICAIPASAETAPVYSTTSVTAAAGKTATIDFTVTNFSTVQGARIKLTVADIAAVTGVTLDGETIANYDAETGSGNLEISGNEIKFMAEFGANVQPYGELTPVNTLVLNIAVKLADGAAVDTVVDALSVDFIDITDGTDTLVTTGTVGTITVVAAECTEHDYEYTNNGDNHTKSCTKCEFSETEAHAYVDGKCVCGAVEEVPCDHANKTYENLGDGANHKVTCADCTEVVAESEAHDLTTGECPCGYKVDNTVLIGRGIIAAEKIGLKVTVYDSYIKAYDDYYVELVADYYDTVNPENAFNKLTRTNKYRYVEDGAEVPAGFTKQDERQSATTIYNYYVAAYEYGCPITIKLHLFKDGKEVAVSQTWNLSIASRILAAGVKGNADDAIFVDTINYGAEAQKYFAAKYPESDLASAALPTVGFEAYQQYATPDSVASVDDIVSVNKGESFNSDGGAVGKGLVVDDTNILRFSVYVPSGKTLEDIQLKVTYSDSIFGGEPVIIEGTDLVVEGTNYYYYCNNIALYDAEAVVTAELIEKDTETVLYKRTYSVESGLSEIKATSPDFCASVMKLTVSMWNTLEGLKNK